MGWRRWAVGFMGKMMFLKERSRGVKTRNVYNVKRHPTVCIGVERAKQQPTYQTHTMKTKMNAKQDILGHAHRLSPRLRAAFPEILDHIESLAEGVFAAHASPKKWGYEPASGTRNSQFVAFSIHSQIGDHLSFSLYGKPSEFEVDGLLPLFKGRGESYSACKFEFDRQKDVLKKYLTSSYELWCSRLNHHGFI